MATARALLEAPDLYFAELSCPPDDPAWGEENQVGRPIVALPAAPVWQVHDGGERRLFNQNDVVFHSAGSEYHRERFLGGGYRCLFLMPAVSLLREVAAEIDPAIEAGPDGHLPSNGGPLDGATFAISRVAAGYLRSGAYPAPARELLYEVLRGTVRASTAERSDAAAATSVTRRARRDLVEAAREVLTARVAEPLSLDDLARGLYSSPYHLARVFRAATGFSIHGYLVQLRLRFGLDRIQGTGQEVGEVGRMLGFRTHSHFSASFRRAFGFTPSTLASNPGFGAGRSPANRARSR